MPEHDPEAVTFGAILSALSLTVALAVYASMWFLPPVATGPGQDTAPNGTTPPTTEEPTFTPECPPTPNETVGRCVDSDGDGSPDYRCYDNVDCGDDQLTLTPTNDTEMEH